MRARRPTAVTILGFLALTAAVVWAVRRARRSPAKRPRRPPMTQTLVPTPAADTRLGPPGENLDDRLDEALRETFPGSDPISLRIE